MSLGIGSFGSGAKARRLATLQQSGVMDMQIEKFTNFSIPAGSAMDRYRRLLTKPNPTIRQFGVPAEDESRSVEVATDDLSPSDKGVQACYGDDTEYLDVVKRIADKQLAQNRGLRHDRSDADHVNAGAGSSNANMESSGSGSGGGGEYSDTNSLVSFLQRASQVCERLIDEGEARSSGRAHIDRTYSVLFLFLFLSFLACDVSLLIYYCLPACLPACLLACLPACLHPLAPHGTSLTIISSHPPLNQSIINENTHITQYNATGSATTNRELFSPEKSWVDLSAAASGAHELIRLRPASSVHFSTLQPHLLISTYEYSPSLFLMSFVWSVSLDLLLPAYIL
jgi:hypothetical protein